LSGTTWDTLRSIATLGISITVALGSGCQYGGCQSERSSTTSETNAVAEPETSKTELELTLEGLVRQLRDPNRREESTAALTALGVVALPALRTALREADPEARIAAVNALEEIGRPEVVDVLLPTLHDADEEVRLEAVEALGVVPDRRAVKPLLERYDKDDDSAVRYEILTTLGLIGDPSTVDFLVGETKDEDRYVRMWAMDALCTMGAANAAAFSVALLDDADVYVRKRVLASCVRALDTPEGHEALIRIALTASDFEESVFARRNLQTYPRAFGSANDLKKQIRTAALPALRQENPIQAALLLADIDDSSGVDQLIPALDHPNQFVRHHAAYQLGRVGSADAVPALIKALSDEQSLVAATAYDALIAFAEQGDSRARTAMERYTGTKFSQRLPKHPQFE